MQCIIGYLFFILRPTGCTLWLSHWALYSPSVAVASVGRPSAFVHTRAHYRQAAAPIPGRVLPFRSAIIVFYKKNSASCKNQFIDKLAACTKLFILNQSLIQYCINIELFSSKNYPVCFYHSVVIKFQHRGSGFRFSLCDGHFYSLIACRCRYCWRSCYA